MITLRCPNCYADLQLDENREYGFCQYCGTKIQINSRINHVHSGIVQVDGVQDEKQRLCAAKAQYDLGNTITAIKQLQQLVLDYPYNGEAWITLAEFMYTYNLLTPLDYFNLIPQLNVDWGKVDSPTTWCKEIQYAYAHSREMESAKRVLSNDPKELWKKSYNRFCEMTSAQAQASCDWIERFNQNPSLLAGFSSYTSKYFEDGGVDTAGGFFLLNDELVLSHSGLYLVRVSGNSLNLTLKYIHTSTTTKSLLLYENCRKESYSIFSANKDYLRLLRKGSEVCFVDYSKYDGGEASLRYWQSIFDNRKTAHRCIYCGGEKGLFGCKLNCASFFHNHF